MKTTLLIFFLLIGTFSFSPEFALAPYDFGTHTERGFATAVFLDSLAWKVGEGDKYSGSKIAVDGSENVYVAGWFKDTIVFAGYTLISKGENDIFITKYDSQGLVQWAHSAGGPASDHVSGMSVDQNGNVHITGYFKDDFALSGSTNLNSAGDYDIFLAAYDTSGKLKWARQAGGKSSDGGADLTTDSSGNIYVVGYFAKQATFQETTLSALGSQDAFVALYSPEGDLEWVRQGGGAGYDWANCVATDRQGNAYITGKFQGIANFGSVKLELSNKIKVPENNGFVVKCSADGQFQWGQRMGGKRETQISSPRASLSGLVIDNQENVFVSGFGFFKENGASFGDTLFTTINPWDSIIAKLDSNGVVQWVMNTVSPGPYKGNMVSDAKRNVFVLTSFPEHEKLTVAGRNSMQTLTSWGGLDFALVNFNNEGNLVWVRQYGGIGNENINAIALSNKGNFYILGSFKEPTLLAGTPLTTDNELATFIMKVPNR